MKISIIIPVFNEVERLRKLLLILQENEYAHLTEIIVADGGSTDGTIENVKSLQVKILLLSAPSRAKQMNAAAFIATGDVLYFMHADILPVNTFYSDIQQAIEQGYEAGCYSYQFDHKNFWLRINAFFNKYNFLGLSGGGDQTLFIKKESFLSLHGFNEKFCIMEDFEFVRRIKKKYSFTIISKEIIVSSRKYIKNNWLKVQIANIIAFTMFRLRTNPATIKLFYQKYIR
ncbi:MAG: TIGR04283 family arsenosugar biosynthesis glycosyltransferase [Chitinophagales bacterium]